MELLKDNSSFVQLPKTIHFKTHERHISLSFDEILFCKAEGCYTKVIMKNFDNILISKSLKAFQAYFPTDQFLRCHNSFFINIKNVKSFDSKKRMIVIDKFILPISRRRSARIFHILALCGIRDSKSNNRIKEFITDCQ